MVNVPLEYILGLAAAETGWETGRIAIEDRNYFSVHAKGPAQPPKFAIGAGPTKGTVHDKVPVYVGIYESFYASGLSFIDKFGKFIFGAPTPEAFALALQGAGFNSGRADTGGSPNFVSNLTKIVPVVKARLACPAPDSMSHGPGM
jgi:hypothetical protein